MLLCQSGYVTKTPVNPRHSGETNYQTILVAQLNLYFLLKYMLSIGQGLSR